MKTAKLLLYVGFIAIVSCATTPSNMPGQTLEIHDLATEFLNDVCAKPNEDAFPNQWLNYERKHWDFYEPVFYYNPERLNDRKSLAEKMAGRKREMCKHTRSFLAIAPSILERMTSKVTELIGASPKAPIYFSVALQGTDGRGAKYKGTEIYTYNARHDTFSTTTGLLATIAHELVHSAHTTKYGREDQKITPLVRSLFWEGGAVYTVQVILPEVGEGATGLKPDELKLAEQKASVAAKELLALWESSSLNEKVEEKFFAGGWKGSEQPRKMGYYIGLQLFKRLATKNGQHRTLQMSPNEFIVQAKPVLAEMAAGK